MTIGMTARQGTGWGWVVLTLLGCLGNAAILHAGDGPGIFTRKPSGPIFKTLDTFAGGIELVLEKTVLKCSKGKPGCDSPSCDDGCDALTLHQFDMQQDSQVVVPKAFQPLPPPSEPMHSLPMHSLPTEPLPTEPLPTESLPPMMEVEPTFDRPIRKSLPEPKPELEQTPVQNRAQQPELSTDDGWIDSFAPSTPIRKATPQRRNDSSAEDALPDPFQDDPQTRIGPQRFSPRPSSAERSQTTRLQYRKSVKAAGFPQPK
jgi:hypothetical protein